MTRAYVCLKISDYPPPHPPGCDKGHLNKLSFRRPKESICNLNSIGPVVSEEKMFEIVDGRTPEWLVYY